MTKETFVPSCLRGLILRDFVADRAWRARLLDGAAYAAAVAPGCIAVALIQYAFYGSPFSSGYGDLGALFAVEHVGPNTSRYARWLLDSHTPVIL